MLPNDDVSMSIGHLDHVLIVYSSMEHVISGLITLVRSDVFELMDSSFGVICVDMCPYMHCTLDMCPIHGNFLEICNKKFTCLMSGRWPMFWFWRKFIHRLSLTVIWDQSLWYPLSTISKHLKVIVGGWILEAVADKLDPSSSADWTGVWTTHALVDMVHHWHAALDSVITHLFTASFPPSYLHCLHSELT